MRILLALILVIVFIAVLVRVALTGLRYEP